MTMSSLPLEMQTCVLSILPLQDLVRCRAVCTVWCRLIDGGHLLRNRLPTLSVYPCDATILWRPSSSCRVLNLKQLSKALKRATDGVRYGERVDFHCIFPLQGACFMEIKFYFHHKGVDVASLPVKAHSCAFWTQPFPENMLLKMRHISTCRSQIFVDNREKGAHLQFCVPDAECDAFCRAILGRLDQQMAIHGAMSWLRVKWKALAHASNR